MKEQVILEIISKCITFLSTEQCQQLRLVLESELHKYKLEQECTDLVPTNDFQSKLLLYLASKKVEGLSDKTLKEYKTTLSHFILESHKDFDKIDEMDIRLYIAKRMQRGINNSTLNTNVSQIKTFYTWMYDNDYIKKNPSKLIKNIKFDKYIRKSFTDEEFEKMRYVCKHPLEHALISVFYSTGARVSEIYQLNKDDIDWQYNRVKVFGKGHKERYVVLNPNSRLYLTKYLEQRNDQNPALFVARKKPHERLSTRSIEKIFHNLGVRAGVNGNVFPHRVRHYTACKLLNKGTPLPIVQDYYGHSSPSTTVIYARMNKVEVEQTVLKNL